MAEAIAYMFPLQQSLVPTRSKLLLHQIPDMQWLDRSVYLDVLLQQKQR